MIGFRTYIIYIHGKDRVREVSTATDFSDKLQVNKEAWDKLLAIDTNFDVLYKDLVIGEREAGFYFIDGFVKDEVMQKLMSSLESITKDKMPQTVEEFSKQWISYVEVDIETEKDSMLRALLSGVVCMFIDGYDKALAIDCRTYPARGVDEPEKDRDKGLDHGA